MTARYRRYIARFISASRLLNELFLAICSGAGGTGAQLSWERGSPFLKDWHKQSPKRSPNLTKNKSLLRKKIDTKAIGEMEDWPGKIRPHRRCWGVIFRMALVKGYRFTWGGGIFRPKPPVFDRSWRSPSKNTVKNSTEDTCSWTRPSKIGKRKVKKPRVFQLFDLNFFGLQHLFLRFRRVAGPGGGFLSFWTRFRTDFRRFVIAETLVFTVFSVFCMLDG